MITKTIPTTDSCFLLAFDIDFRQNTRDSWLVKVSPNGDIVWNALIGESDSLIINNIFSGTDGSIIMTGSAYYRDPRKVVTSIMALDKAGNTLWKHRFEGSLEFARSHENSSTIAASVDSNYIVSFMRIDDQGTITPLNSFPGVDSCGIVGLYPASDGNFLIVANCFTAQKVNLLKANGNGEPIRNVFYSTEEFDDFFGWPILHAPADNGSDLLMGCIYDKQEDVVVLKIGSACEIMWKRYYGNSGENYPYSILHMNDDNYLLTLEDDNSDFCLAFKIDLDGNTLWSRPVPEQARRAFYQAPPALCAMDGNLMVFGSRSNSVLEIIDLNGASLWSKEFSKDTSSVFLTSIFPTSDNTYLLAGFTERYTWFVDTVFRGATSRTTESSFIVFSIIADQYAYKNDHFSFQIPNIFNDSDTPLLQPINIPEAMTVSKEGLVSWVPTTDSIYMEHVEFLATGTDNQSDTLSFNIFVNSPTFPASAASKANTIPVDRKLPALRELTIAVSRSGVTFSLAPSYTMLTVYDINGHMVIRRSLPNKVTKNTIFWTGKTPHGNLIPCGRYIAVASTGTEYQAKNFLLIR